MRTLLKVSALFNLFYLLGIVMAVIASITQVGFSGMFGLIGLLYFLATTYIYYTDADKDIEYLYKAKTKLIILSVLGFFVNPLVTVLVLIAVTKINTEYMEEPHEEIEEEAEEEIDPEIKKIDIMLKLGVGMVIVSGIIFATSSWEIITPNMKVILLIVMGGLFIGLSRFSEVKLKLKDTTSTYWILGMSFFVFSFLSAGYFAIFGEWFSLDGEGYRLYLAALCLLISGVALLSYNKFKIEGYLYLLFAALLSFLIEYLNYFAVSSEAILLTLTAIISILNVVRPKDNVIARDANKFAGVVTIILGLSALIILNFEPNIATMFFCSILLVLNLIYLALKEKVDLHSGVMSLLIVVLPILTLIQFDLTLELKLTIGTLIVAMIYGYLMLSKLLPQNKVFNHTFTLIVNIVLLISCLIGFYDGGISYLLIAAMLLGVNFVYLIARDDSNKVEYFSQPFKILVFVYTLLYWTNINLFEITWLVTSCIAYLTMIIAFTLVKEEDLRYGYFIAFVAVLVLSLLSVSELQLIPSLVVLGSAFLPFVITNNNSDERYKQLELPAYLFLLIAGYWVVVLTNIFQITETNSSLIVISIYAVLMSIFYKRKDLFTFTNIILIAPITVFLNSLLLVEPFSIWENGENILMILSTAFYLYVAFLCTEHLVDDKKNKDVVLSILVSFILLMVIFIDALIIGLYVGFIAIGLLLYGFYHKEYRILFYTGVTFTIINIIYQMWDLWTKIPFWLYLLVIGLSLIGLVTNIQLKKLESSKED